MEIEEVIKDWNNNILNNNETKFLIVDKNSFLIYSPNSFYLCEMKDLRIEAETKK